MNGWGPAASAPVWISSSYSLSIPSLLCFGRGFVGRAKAGHEGRAALVGVQRPAAQQPLARPFVHEVAEVLGAPDLGIVVVVEVHSTVDVGFVAPLEQVEHEVDVVPLATHVGLVEAEAQ